MICLNCGQSNPCLCTVIVSELGEVSGIGTEEEPTTYALTCETVQDCVGTMFSFLDMSYDDDADRITADGGAGTVLTVQAMAGIAEWT